MSYLERHNGSGFRVGDRVKILRKASDFENGWDDVWDPFEMDQTVGLEGVIVSNADIGGFGIQIDNEAGYSFYPYFVLRMVGEEPVAEKKIRYEDPAIDDLIDILRRRYPHGHEDFIPMTMDEMELHSTKNHDYAFGGKATGNFDRVATILAQYPGLDLSRPCNVATVYLLKQLDAALWLECKGHDAKVEGQDARWGDVSVYAKIIRLLIKERKGGSDV